MIISIIIEWYICLFPDMQGRIGGSALPTAIWHTSTRVYAYHDACYCYMQGRMGGSALPTATWHTSTRVYAYHDACYCYVILRTRCQQAVTLALISVTRRRALKQFLLQARRLCALYVTHPFSGASHGRATQETPSDGFINYALCLWYHQQSRQCMLQKVTDIYLPLLTIFKRSQFPECSDNDHFMWYAYLVESN